MQSRPESNDLVSAIYAAITLLCIAIVYFLAVDLTKPSFVQSLQPMALAELSAFLVSIAIAVAAAFGAAAWAVSAVARRLGMEVSRKTVVATLTAACLAPLFCLAIENFAYTVFGLGLKNTTHAAIKVLYMAASVGLAVYVYKSHRSLAGTALFQGSGAALVLLGLTAASAITLAHNAGLLSTDPETSVAREVRSPYNVVILSSDGINASNLGIYGYERATTPFLSSIEQELLIADYAFSNNASTTGSITSLLTGRLPTKTGVVYAPDAMRASEARKSLPALLRKAGYFTSNFAVPYYADSRSVNMIDAFDVEFGVEIAKEDAWLSPIDAPNQRLYVSNFYREWSNIAFDMVFLGEAQNLFDNVEDQRRNQTNKAGKGQLEAERLATVRAMIRTKDRFFSNTHFMTSHGAKFPIERAFFAKGQQQSKGWMIDFYDDAILVFDQRIAAVYEELKQAGKLETTILIVTSDHGMRYDSTRRIPLLMRLPNRMKVGRIGKNVQSIDVAPTILDALGMDKPSWMTGTSLLRHEDIPADRPIFSGQYGKPGNVRDTSELGSLGALWVRACDRLFRLAVTPDRTAAAKSVKGEGAACVAAPQEPLDERRASELLNQELRGG